LPLCFATRESLILWRSRKAAKLTLCETHNTLYTLGMNEQTQNDPSANTAQLRIEIKGPLIDSLDTSFESDTFTFYLVRELRESPAVLSATYSRQSNTDHLYFSTAGVPAWKDFITIAIPFLSAGAIYVAKKFTDLATELVKARLTDAAKNGSKIEEVRIFGPDGTVVSIVKRDQ